MHDARQVRFWIGAIALTAINLSVWFFATTDRPNGPAMVRIVYSSSADLFAETGRLLLGLDRDLYTEDQVGRPLERSPFRIEPPISGDWQILSRGQVAFEPHDPPLPGRLYRVALTPSHPMFRYHQIDESTLPELHYQPLEVDFVRLEEVKNSEESKAVKTATMTVEFNYPVDRRALEAAMSVSVGGRLTAYKMTSEPIGSTHQMTVPCAPDDVIDVLIGKDLVGDGGLLPLGRATRETFKIAGHLSAMQATSRRSYDGRPSLEIRFDRALALGQTIPSVIVKPSVGPLNVRLYKQTMYINGRFLGEQAYSITVQTPLLAIDGSTLREPIVRSAFFDPPNPTLSFGDQGSQIIPGGRFEVAIRHDQLKKMKLTVDRLLDQNLPMFLADVLSTKNLMRLSERIVDRELEMDGDSKREQWRSRLDLESVMERKPGLYHLRISNPENRWLSDSRTLLVSNLALETQIDTNSVLVWVTSIDSGQPVPGASVTAWAPDQSEIAQFLTDDRGIVQIPFDGQVCDLVAATLGDDLAYARLDRASRSDDAALRGSPWAGPIDLAMYADRGVHRPGEVIHLTGVVRHSNGKPIYSTPLEIRWTRPDGKLIATQEVFTDDQQGFFQCDVTTDASAMTGTWLVTAHLPGDDRIIRQMECPVMPFLPVRLKVNSEFVTISDKPGAAIEIDVEGRYLHGGPAAGLATTIAVRFDPIRATFPTQPDLTFESTGNRQTIRRLLRGTLGPEGRARHLVQSPKTPGAWRITAVASVIEFGGRATASTVRGRVDTARRHLGLGLPGGIVYRPEESITIETLALLDGEADPSVAPTVTIESIEYRWQRVNGRNWTSTMETHPVAMMIPPPTALEYGGTSLELPPLPQGAYRVLASIQTSTGRKIVATREFNVSSWMSRDRRPSDRPDRLRLVPGGGPARPGDLVDVMIGADFAGLAMVTVETDRIHQAQIIELGIGGGMVTVRIPDEVRDTCFVAATLIRPNDASSKQRLPLLSRGAARIPIDREPYRLHPDIVASDSARPGELVHFALSVPTPESMSSAAMVHLWAVEEGALLVTNHHAPDLVRHFLSDRARVVRALDTRRDVLPEHDRSETMDRIGGDAAAAHREPVPVRIPDIQVIWRTAMPLPADGRLDLDLEMPELDGAMRIMAVVVDDDRYGATEHVIGVTPALQLTAALPRAAAPGDAMRIPVSLRNNTTRPMTARIRVDSGEGLKATLDVERVSLAVAEAVMVELSITATGIGSIPIQIRAEAIDPVLDSLMTGGPATELARHVAVRPPHGRSQEVIRLVALPGKRVVLNRDHDLEILAGRIDIVVGGRPVTNLGDAVDGLIEYPYGCGEQIGSKIEGILAALMVDPAISGEQPEVLRAMAADGFRRLWKTQRADGMIPYWSGGQGNAWLTVRSAAIAQNAQRHQIPLPPNFLKGLIAATARVVRKPSSHGFQPLAVRVLTEAGQTDAAMLQVLNKDAESFSVGDRAQIAFTLAVLGREDDADRIFDTFVVPDLFPPTTNGYFNSDVMQASLALSVLMTHRPHHPMVIPMLEFVLAGLQDNQWRTTYEAAAAVKAIAAWAKENPADSTLTGELMIAGERIVINGTDPIRRHIKLPIGTSLAALDEFVMATGENPIHVSIVTSGVPRDRIGDDHESNGLTVTRRWLDAEGNILESNEKITAGDVITVEVEYASTTRRNIPNIAIVEVLPGGMEFELPVLVTSASGSQSLGAVDRSEFRDDRLIVFDTATPKSQLIRYAMRAIVPGTWSVPGAAASSMYVADIEARTPNRAVEIMLP
jgi:uncharacterized protein YfaS (alpha-2-macroglobulin family)